MQDPGNLAVDPSSPDAPVEDKFFKQGVDQELHARYDGRGLEEENRRARRLRLAASGGIGVVGLVAVGLLISGGPEPTPASVAVLSPAVTALAPPVAAPAPPVAAPAPPEAAGTPSPAPAPPLPAAPAPAPVAAPAAAPVVAPVTAALTATTPAAPDLEQSCRSAFDRKKYREVLESCARAFEARPQAADLAVLVAEAELDRGRAAAALSWARKAVAMDPTLADAYVFIGSAEQQSGHVQEARTAYLKYLELAPGGRFAQDLRAIVKSL